MGGGGVSSRGRGAACRGRRWSPPTRALRMPTVAPARPVVTFTPRPPATRHLAEVGVGHEIPSHPAGDWIHADPIERGLGEKRVGARADRVLEQTMRQDDDRSSDARPPADELSREASVVGNELRVEAGDIAAGPAGAALVARQAALLVREGREGVGQHGGTAPGSVTIRSGPRAKTASPSSSWRRSGDSSRPSPAVRRIFPPSAAPWFDLERERARLEAELAGVRRPPGRSGPSSADPGRAA